MQPLQARVAFRNVSGQIRLYDFFVVPLLHCIHICRGSRFLSTFTDTGYREIEQAFSRISKSQEIIREFDLLTEKILDVHLFKTGI